MVVLPGIPEIKSFTVRGTIGSIKNERVPFVKSDGTVATRLNKAVNEDIARIRATLRGCTPVEEEQGIIVFAGVFTKEKDTIPNKDIDNILQTVIEATQGYLVPAPQHHGDRCYAYAQVIRNKIPVKDFVYTRFFVWRVTCPGDLKSTLLEINMVMQRIYESLP